MENAVQSKEYQKLVNQLESVFTIDGQGRPAKAALFLELLQKNELNTVLRLIQEISQRKFF